MTAREGLAARQVREAVDGAPPLTRAQLDKLVPIFRPSTESQRALDKALVRKRATRRRAS